MESLDHLFNEEIDSGSSENEFLVDVRLKDLIELEGLDVVVFVILKSAGLLSTLTSHYCFRHGIVPYQRIIPFLLPPKAEV